MSCAPKSVRYPVLISDYPARVSRLNEEATRTFEWPDVATETNRPGWTILCTHRYDVCMFKTVAIFLLTIAGALVVSVLKERQAALSCLLLGVLAIHLGIVWARHHDRRIFFEDCFCLITFGVIGYLTESWGTTHGHWHYYHLPPGQTVPYWVPIAWSIASVLIGKVEKYLDDYESSRVTPHSVPVRIGCIFLSGMLLPLTGESICIALGVWEYHWPVKILGVPLLALMLISYAHLVFSLIKAGGASWRESRAAKQQ